MAANGRRWLLLGLAIAISQGCARFGLPQIDNPGTAAEQQRRAERFDPFPENDVGPDIVGSRPLDFQRPAAETSRSRWLSNPWNGRP